MKILGAIVLALAAAVTIVPNAWRSRQRLRQKQTMSDMRSIATAWEARANDTNTYEVAASAPANMKTVRYADLRRVLTPTYIRQMPPERDGWGHPLQFASSKNGYFIRSTGSDKRVDHHSGVTDSFENDVVYGNGQFLEYPEGL